MADSKVDITEGSGVSVDTRTEADNGQHRQVVVVGDPSTTAGVAPVDATNGLAVDVKALPASTNTIEVVGDAAENAAVAGNPVLTGGRYDATPRTLGDGDVGALALDADGALHISDGGNTITVDGTVTANLSATDNTVLDNIQTSVDTVAAAVSTEMQVDVVAALPAGSNTIGDVTISGDALTALQLIDDAVAAEGSALGKGVLLQGDDGTDRKNINVDATTGDVQVDVTNTVTVDGSGVTQPVSGTVTANLSATDNAVLDNIDTDTSNIDTNTTDVPNVIGTDGTAGPTKVLSIGGTESGGNIQEARVDSDGHFQVDVLSAPTTTVTGTVTANLSTTDNTVLDNIQTAVEIIDNAISGNEMQVDIVTAPTITVDHAITDLADGVKTVTTAGTDEALAGSTACKRVVIQAQTDNTGWIAVGNTGVDATEATGTGVLLGAGDSFELEIDNLADVYIDSTVDGEGVRYTYFT